MGKLGRKLSNLFLKNFCEGDFKTIFHLLTLSNLFYYPSFPETTLNLFLMNFILLNHKIFSHFVSSLLLCG